MSSANGFKHVGFLTRKKGQSFEDFVKHWDEVHSDNTQTSRFKRLCTQPHRSGKIPRFPRRRFL